MPRHATATSFGGKRGNPRGTEPGPGVPPETFRARMRLLASRAKTVKNVETILDDPDHPKFDKMLQFAADQGYGKPKETVEHDIKGGLTIKVVREE